MNRPLKAVALRYPEGAEAPFICAKAKGKLAEKVLEIAKENDIPVVEDELLSEVLTVEEIGTVIPEQTFELVAKIFAFVVENEKKL